MEMTAFRNGPVVAPYLKGLGHQLQYLGALNRICLLAQRAFSLRTTIHQSRSS